MGWRFVEEEAPTASRADRVRTPADERTRLETMLNDPVLQELASVAAVQNWLSREIPTAALIDLTTMAVCDDAEQRYEMLSEPRTTIRAAWLDRWLRQARKTLALRPISPAEEDATG